MSTTSEVDRRFLVTRVRLRAYRSHAACDVSLRPLSFLVGPNGSGKSNFMDALSFVSNSLRASLEEALHDRHGFAEVAWRGRGESNRFGVRIDFEHAGNAGHYAFTVVRNADEEPEVEVEECLVETANARRPKAYFLVEDKAIVDSMMNPEPDLHQDALYLPVASNHNKVFWHVFQHLRNMTFYQLSPKSMRGFVAGEPGSRLMHDGKNSANVLKALEDRTPDAKRHVVEYLSKVVPGLLSADQKTFGNLQTIEFLQEGSDPEERWRFLAHSMSDGTLHALGVLLAAFQRSHSVGLVGIEEPESAISPSVAGILTAALEEASDRRQILVSTQGADLLDGYDIPSDSIIAVAVRNGRSHIGPADEVGRGLLQEKQFTPGELMRAGQLRPEFPNVEVNPNDVSLFGP